MNYFWIIAVLCGQLERVAGIEGLEDKHQVIGAQCSLIHPQLPQTLVLMIPNPMDPVCDVNNSILCLP